MTGRERGAAAVLLVFGLIALEEASRLRFGSLATALLTYLVFRVWLNVQLPAGLWGG